MSTAVFPDYESQSDCFSSEDEDEEDDEHGDPFLRSPFEVLGGLNGQSVPILPNKWEMCVYQCVKYCNDIWRDCQTFAFCILSFRTLNRTSLSSGVSINVSIFTSISVSITTTLYVTAAIFPFKNSKRWKKERQRLLIYQCNHLVLPSHDSFRRKGFVKAKLVGIEVNRQTSTMMERRENGMKEYVRKRRSRNQGRRAKQLNELWRSDLETWDVLAIKKNFPRFVYLPF